MVKIIEKVKTARVARWYLAAIFITIQAGSPALAVIDGDCFNCHAMHDGFESLLTQEACLACHAQGESALYLIGVDYAPQVMHSDPTVDLAGGNFAYITGDKGSGASDSKGHNIAGLTGEDGHLYGPPGEIGQYGHDSGLIVNTENLTCAGTNGCHGYRLTGDTSLDGISGSHHGDVDGRLAVADSKGNSYRFLVGVKGYESPDWEYSSNASKHNEYFAIKAPIQLTCSAGRSCHSEGDPPGIVPPDGTISQFCASCHGNFHTLQTADLVGVGSDVESPFVRHPTDLVLPDRGEYLAYDSYNILAPVARTGSVPELSSDRVEAGKDAVMCLSCHRAHASNYPDMLRWDYSKMIAGGGEGAAVGEGCFVCHTAKDD